MSRYRLAVPAQRDPTSIAADLLDGYVTLEEAARICRYRPGERGEG